MFLGSGARSPAPTRKEIGGKNIVPSSSPSILPIMFPLHLPKNVMKLFLVMCFHLFNMWSTSNPSTVGTARAQLGCESGGLGQMTYLLYVNMQNDLILVESFSDNIKAVGTPFFSMALIQCLGGKKHPRRCNSGAQLPERGRTPV